LLLSVSSLNTPTPRSTLFPYTTLFRSRSDFTVASGLSHPDVGPSHDSMNSFLTAAPHPERRAGFRNSISLDQFAEAGPALRMRGDRKSTRLNSSHVSISYAVFCLKKKR